MRRLHVLPADSPTASRVGLARRCQYPWTSGQRPSRRDVGAEAAVGTVVHRGAEAAIRWEGWEDGAADLSTLPEDDRETAADLIEVVQGFIADERERPHRVYEAEVPVEIDVATGEGRRLPSKGHRDYSARSPRALAGTADHVLWPDSSNLTVRDWKTGQQRGLAHEAARMQVRTLGVAMAAIYDVEEINVEVASISGAGVEIEREQIDGAALEEHLDMLRVLAVKLTGGPSRPNPGPWCVEMFCPLLGECPASRGALAAVTREAPILTIADDATALRVIEGLPRMRAALDAIDEALDEYIRRSPPRGPDGRRYGFQDHERRDVAVRTPEQRRALTTVLGSFAESAVETKFTTTIAGIERAARKALAAVGKKRGIGELRDKALEALANAGGVRVNTYQRPAWFWPEGTQQPGEGTRDLPMTGENEDG